MRVPIQACRHVPVRRAGLPGMALLAAVAVLLGVTACAGQTENGTVYGTVVGGGGPFRPAKPVRPMQHVTVIAIGAHSPTRFTTVTSQHGAFSLTLPPGTYVLLGPCVEHSGSYSRIRKFLPRVRVPPGGRVKRDIECVAV